MKHPELKKFAKLRLTSCFHQPQADGWDKAAILARAKILLVQPAQIWPEYKPAVAA